MPISSVVCVPGQRPRCQTRSPEIGCLGPCVCALRNKCIHRTNISSFGQSRVFRHESGPRTLSEPNRPRSVIKASEVSVTYVPCPYKKQFISIALRAKHVGLRCGWLGWNPARSSRVPSCGYSFVAAAACINSFGRRFPPEPRPNFRIPGRRPASSIGCGSSQARLPRGKQFPTIGPGKLIFTTEHGTCLARSSWLAERMQEDAPWPWS